jgi:hypothetical protein
VTALGLAALARRPSRLRLAVGAGLMLLIASGTVRGEVGRIWVPLMPLLLVAALGEPDGPARREALLIGALLAVIGLALRVYWILP